ncbi:esterase/lipase [Opitutaceae bacterium TAV1]|nr:esterase/lipase [Opitutaceae bacterium TAV1]
MTTTCSSDKKIRFGLFAATALGLALSVRAAEVAEQHDMPYLDAGRQETLDLYLPAPSPDGARRAGVVWIHGGGWAAGTKRDRREVAVSRGLAEAGFVVVSVDYRLATKEQPGWPVAVQDCKNAVRFLRAHADKYGIDPARIAVAGGSAGAHLALMVAYTANDPALEPSSPYPGVSNEVGAVIELYGITNLLTRQKADKQGNPTGQLVDSSAPRFTGKTRAEGSDLWRYASPVSHVRRDVPPTFISHGKRDATVDYPQALELADALKAAGVTYELVMLEKAGHTFDLTHWGKHPLEKDLTPLVVGFLQKHLGGK